MTEIKKINIRLDLSKETPRRAWEYLQALDRKKFLQSDHLRRAGRVF